MNETAQLIGTTIGMILGFAFILLLILTLMYLLIYTYKTEKMRQKYIKNLNDHDKSVIMDYQNTFWTLSKHEKQKNKDR